MHLRTESQVGAIIACSEKEKVRFVYTSSRSSSENENSRPTTACGYSRWVNESTFGQVMRCLRPVFCGLSLKENGAEVVLANAKTANVVLAHDQYKSFYDMRTTCGAREPPIHVEPPQWVHDCIEAGVIDYSASFKSTKGGRKAGAV